MGHLADWQQRMFLTAKTDVDPMQTVLREGGPLHTRKTLPAYLRRLRETGREHHAERRPASTRRRHGHPGNHSTLISLLGFCDLAS